MSKKHFIILAAEIRKMLDKDQRLNAAVAVASACQKISPTFDAQRFYEARGVTA